MPFDPMITQRYQRKHFCKTCYIQLMISCAFTTSIIHELWRSPFPRSPVACVFKFCVCAFSLLPLSTFLVECCTDPIYCNPAHGHSWALRARDLLCGALYWGIRF